MTVDELTKQYSVATSYLECYNWYWSFDRSLTPSKDDIGIQVCFTNLDTGEMESFGAEFRVAVYVRRGDPLTFTDLNSLMLFLISLNNDRP